MDQVDFGYVGKDGLTIYNICFQRYIKARFILKRPEAEWKILVKKTETVFDYLVEEGNKRGFEMYSILEIPTSNGTTCFALASQCSKKISKYIVGRGIKVNSIKTDMLVPEFTYPDLAIPMMKKESIHMLFLMMGAVQAIIIHPASKRKKQNSYWLNFQDQFTFPLRTFTVQKDVLQTVRHHSRNFISKMESS